MRIKSARSWSLFALTSLLLLLTTSACVGKNDSASSLGEDKLTQRESLRRDGNDTQSLKIGLSSTIPPITSSDQVDQKPPCHRTASNPNPCDLRATSSLNLFSGSNSGGMRSTHTPVATVEELLEKGFRLAEASPTHIVIRATAQEDSVRCDWRGIARTREQRREALRFWLGIDEQDPVPDASYLQTLFDAAFTALSNCSESRTRIGLIPHRASP